MKTCLVTIKEATVIIFMHHIDRSYIYFLIITNYNIFSQKISSYLAQDKQVERRNEQVHLERRQQKEMHCN